MAVAFVSANEGLFSSANTQLTVSGVNGAAGNIVIACVSYRDNTGSDISGVTYSGSAMTQFGSEWSGGGRSIGIFYLVNPTGTSQDVVATFSASTNLAQMTVLVLSGADTSSPFGTAQTSNGSTDETITSALSCTTDDLCFDVLCVGANVAVIGAGQTLRGSPGSSTFQEVSTEPGGSSVTMSWSGLNGIDWIHVAVPVLSGASTTYPQNRVRLVGTGTIGQGNGFGYKGF